MGQPRSICGLLEPGPDRRVGLSETAEGKRRVTEGYLRIVKRGTGESAVYTTVREGGRCFLGQWLGRQGVDGKFSTESLTVQRWGVNITPSPLPCFLHSSKTTGDINAKLPVASSALISRLLPNFQKKKSVDIFLETVF